MTDKGYQFTTDNHNDIDDDKITVTDPEKAFGLSALAPYCLLEALGMDSSDSENTPFQIFKNRMTDLRPDGKLAKLIMEPGMGDQMKHGLTVNYHYAFYFDDNVYPFDISDLRRIPESFTLGEDVDPIRGIPEALLTMKKGELSYFYIDYSLAFGELGCPPRIPPRQNILARIELLNYVSAPVEKKDTEPSSIVDALKKAKHQRLKGNEHFKMNQKQSACKYYQQAADLLLDTKLMDAKEEQLMKEELIKIYRNLVLCFNDLKLYKKTCTVGNDAFRFCPDEVKNDNKLLYHFGKALRILQNYEEAERKLKQAFRLDSKNLKIKEELEKLKVDMAAVKKLEKERCMKMLEFIDVNDKKNDEEKENHSNVETNMDETTKAWKGFLEKFVQDNNKHLTRASKCSSGDVQVIKVLCEKMKLSCREIKDDLFTNVEIAKKR